MDPFWLPDEHSKCHIAIRSETVTQGTKLGPVNWDKPANIQVMVKEIEGWTDVNHERSRIPWENDDEAVENERDKVKMSVLVTCHQEKPRVPDTSTEPQNELSKPRLPPDIVAPFISRGTVNKKERRVVLRYV